MVLVGPATGLMVDLLGLGAAAGAGAAALENTRWDIPTAGVSTVLRKVGMVMVVVTKNDESQEADWMVDEKMTLCLWARLCCKNH